jgi:hypothetical protein
MEVAYYKISGPKDRKQARVMFSQFIEILGEENFDLVAIDNSDKSSDRIFIFNDLSVIENIKNFFLEKGYLLEFEIKTKDYLISKEIDPILFNDENYDILSTFFKETLTIDDVLDKINYSGLDSLNKLDYLILNGKNNGNLSKTKKP